MVFRSSSSSPQGGGGDGGSLVFPVGLTCFVASCLFPNIMAHGSSYYSDNNEILMLCMAMGSFAGATRLHDNNQYQSNLQLLQTSILATILFHLELLPKIIGGRLGLFALLGVLFGL